MLEKSIHDQTPDYLQRNELLYCYQSGFIANHSTDTYVSCLMDMILNNAENGKHAGMILIDLQKAFDTLDLKMLLEKRKCISFSDKATYWFHSYLTNRAFFVSLDNVFSEVGTINSRIPQGSVLGPLFFSLYINYIPLALPGSQTYLHAGGISIFYQHKDVMNIENILNKKFANLCE